MVTLLFGIVVACAQPMSADNDVVDVLDALDAAIDEARWKLEF